MIRQKFTLLTLTMILLALYFWGHNVPDTPFFLSVRGGFLQIGKSAWDILLVAVLALTSGGIGRFLIGEYLESLSLAEKISIESAFGLSVISLGALILGLVGCFNLSLWLGLGIILILTIRQTWAWFGDVRRVLSFELPTAWTRFVAALVGFLLTLAFLLALAPPFAWDAMTYHLLAPARYLAEGAILPQPDNHFLGFPQLIEVLYGVLMALGSSATAAILHFYLACLALITTGGLLRRYVDANAAAFGVLVLISSYSVWLLLAWAYVDLALMAYGACLLNLLALWRETQRGDLLILLGLFAGFALGVKYTAASMILALLIVILLQNLRVSIKHLSIFSLALGLAFIAWAIKGALLYQNPIYPYLFGGLSWDSLRAANFGASGAGLLNSNLAWQIPILPFAATLFGQEKLSPYAASLNLWLLTMPFALLLTRQRLNEAQGKLTQTATRLGLPLLAFWMLLAAFSGIGAQPRLLLIGAPVAAILAGLAFQSISNLPKKPLDLRFILQSLIILTSLVNALEALHHFADSRVLEYHTGIISAETYLDNQDVYFSIMRRLEVLPAESQVLLMWEPKSYTCPAQIRCIPDVLYDHWSRPLLQGTSPEALMQSWRDEGIDYLLVYGLNTPYNVGYDFWLETHGFATEVNAQFPSLLEERMSLVWDTGLAKLYRWNEE